MNPKAQPSKEGQDTLIDAKKQQEAAEKQKP